MTKDLATGAFVDFDVLVDRGPHPKLEGGFTAFHEDVVAAFG